MGEGGGRRRGKTCFTNAARDVGIRGEGEEFCVAGGVNARGTVEGSHFQSGVVCKTVDAVVLEDEARLLQGVSLEGVGGFGDVLMAAYVCESEHLEVIAENLAYFLEFMGVVGGENKFHRGERGLMSLSGQIPRHRRPRPWSW